MVVEKTLKIITLFDNKQFMKLKTKIYILLLTSLLLSGGVTLAQCPTAEG